MKKLIFALAITAISVLALSSCRTNYDAAVQPFGVGPGYEGEIQYRQSQYSEGTAALDNESRHPMSVRSGKAGKGVKPAY